MKHTILPAILLALSFPLAAPAAPLEVGGRKQLFIDQRFIAQSENIALTANPAQKMGLIFDQDGKKISGHVSRLMDVDGKFHLYVGADSVELYESEDGVHFKEMGSVGGGVFTTVFLDPHDPDPARRYKKFWGEYGEPFDPAVHGVFAGYSPDGKDFTTAGRVLPFFADNPTVVHWDERIGKYVIFLRALDYNSENQRRIARIETEDPLQPWPYTKTDNDRMFFAMENAQVVFSADADDNPHSDIYYNAASIYPYAQDVYLMFNARFRHFSPERNPYIKPRQDGHWEDFGFLEIQLAVSRDGISWTSPSREPYFPTGLADEWDRWYAVLAPGIVKRGNYLYQYYNSSGRTHDSVIIRPEYDTLPDEELGGIGLTKQRLDGFVSADADFHGGWLDTPLLKFQGKKLRLNIDTGAMGTAFVELRDESGNPIPGFTLADCEEIGGNFIDQAVYWKGSTDVSTLQDKAVSLHIKIVRGKLYAFQFTEE